MCSSMWVCGFHIIRVCIALVIQHTVQCEASSQVLKGWQRLKWLFWMVLWWIFDIISLFLRIINRFDEKNSRAYSVGNLEKYLFISSMIHSQRLFLFLQWWIFCSCYPNMMARLHWASAITPMCFKSQLPAVSTLQSTHLQPIRYKSSNENFQIQK